MGVRGALTRADSGSRRFVGVRRALLAGSTGSPAGSRLESGRRLLFRNRPLERKGGRADGRRDPPRRPRGLRRGASRRRPIGYAAVARPPDGDRRRPVPRCAHHGLAILRRVGPSMRPGRLDRSHFGIRRSLRFLGGRQRERRPTARRDALRVAFLPGRPRRFGPASIRNLLLDEKSAPARDRCACARAEARACVVEHGRERH